METCTAPGGQKMVAKRLKPGNLRSGHPGVVISDISGARSQNVLLTILSHFLDHFAYSQYPRGPETTF